MGSVRVRVRVGNRLLDTFFALTALLRFRHSFFSAHFNCEPRRYRRNVRLSRQTEVAGVEGGIFINRHAFFRSFAEVIREENPTDP